MLAGQSLTIDCRVRDGRVVAVDIGPRFLPPLGLLLRDATPAEALSRAAALFALCRHGQCLALSRAIGQALDAPPAPSWRRLLRALRDLEILREHGLNLLRLPGWPLPDPALPARLLAALDGAARALTGGAGSAVFVPDGGSISLDGALLEERGARLWDALEALLGADWLAEPDPVAAEFRCIPRLPCAAPLATLAADSAFGAMAPSPLPARLPEAELAEHLFAADGAEFCARPTWRGETRETGCYARRGRAARIAAARPGARRLLARLEDMRVVAHGLRRRLRDLAARPETPKPAPRRADGFGLGQAQTARGLLVHAVELRAGVVRDCRYVAPTEWNFHPKGLVTRALLGQTVGDEEGFRRRAALWLHCVDPCVEFVIGIGAADD